MKLSVIILNYNVQYFLQHCLLSVRQAVSGIDAEVIVVDNASSDESLAMVKANFPEVNLIVNTTNGGFSQGNNIGVAQAKGEYICLLNPDTFVSEQTFKNALNKAETLANLGALGVKMIDGTGNFLPESKRNVPTLGRAIKKLLGNSQRSGYYATGIEASEDGDVDILVGAFMLCKKQRYLEVGGLDEDYFMYGEDIDLSYKFINAGYKNYYLGSQTIVHYKGESTVRNRAYYDRFYNAMLIFYKKHFPEKKLATPIIAIATFFLKRIAVFKAPKNTITTNPKQDILMLSENMQLLQQLTPLLEGSIKSISKNRAMDGGIRDKKIILDAQYVGYSGIISLMELLKNQQNKFRIYPENCQFIVGSDYSDQKGEVIHW